MKLFTATRFKRQAGQQRLVIILPLIFLALLLIGAGHYSTTKSSSRPASLPVSAALPAESAPPIVTGANSLRPAVASAATFAPFLDIVPSTDGTALFVKAGGVGQLGGTAFVNIGVGPGHGKGSYTMVYSDTPGIYIATATGFTPNTGASGPLSITTTLGLDTGDADFNRAYIPPSATPTISSQDNNLQLTLVNTDTLPAEAYIVVVPSYSLPGPLPAGHRLVGSSYSVRASGALATSDRPMSLRLSYDNNALAGADPHTLAIFAWDGHNNHWDNLGGTLFSNQQFVSIATSRFTSYALVSLPAWRDKFDDLSGLDLGQLNNITLGGTPQNRTLILLNTPGSGSAVSQPISPAAAIAGWDSLTFSSAADPPATTLSVDVLSATGTPLLTNASSGASLASLDPDQYPALKLRLNLSSTAAGQTPALAEWQVSWQVQATEVFLPVIVK